LTRMEGFPEKDPLSGSGFDIPDAIRCCCGRFP
jgi:hypothetical protein